MCEPWNEPSPTALPSRMHLNQGVRQRRRRTLDSQIESLQQELKTALGTKVQIKQGSRQRGQIVVHFTSPGEFERLRGILTGKDERKGASAA